VEDDAGDPSLPHDTTSVTGPSEVATQKNTKTGTSCSVYTIAAFTAVV